MMNIVAWNPSEKPNLNQWYKVRYSEHNDFYRIKKDFHSPEMRRTYYKIVSFYDGQTVEQGMTLSEARDFIRDTTYRQVI